jgi:hypothetical protein
VGAFLCCTKGPNGCSYYEVSKEVYAVLTAAREAQFAALAKRVAQAQQLAAHDEAVQQQQGQGRFADDLGLDRGGGGGAISQQQQELRGWFEAGRRVKSLPEALGTRKHTSFFFFAAFLR